MDILGVSEDLEQRVIEAGRMMLIPADSQHLSHRLAAASVIVEKLQGFCKGFKKLALMLVFQLFIIKPVINCICLLLLRYCLLPC